METNEKRFEYDIEEYLITKGGYEQFAGQKHDAPSGISMWIHNRQHDVENVSIWMFLSNLSKRHSLKYGKSIKNTMAKLHRTNSICDLKRLSAKKDFFMFCATV